MRTEKEIIAIEKATKTIIEATLVFLLNEISEDDLNSIVASAIYRAIIESKKA